VRNGVKRKKRNELEENLNRMNKNLGDLKYQLTQLIQSEKD
jgi:hypothetical protein